MKWADTISANKGGTAEDLDACHFRPLDEVIGVFFAILQEINMQEELKQIETEGLTDLETVSDLRELESLRIKYFGRRGLLSTVMRGMG